MKETEQMGMSRLFKRTRSMRIAVIFLCLLLSYGLVSFSPRADGELKLFSIDLGGVTGGANNLVLVFGRYVLIAPFAPSQGVLENGDLDIDRLDNDLLYMVDTKKPNSPAISRELKVWDARTQKFNKIFYPSRIAFDPNSNNVYVRGTKFEEVDGEITPVDVVAYLNLTLDDNGKLVDTPVVPIEIPGVGTPKTSNAPLDFAFSNSGEILVFTNGASVFSFNLAEGFLQEVNVIAPGEYNDGSSISFLDVDSATNIVSVCWTRNINQNGKITGTASDLFFYSLTSRGSFLPLTHLRSDSLLEGESVAVGSKVAIISDAVKDGTQTAVFVTSMGTLCAIDLQSGDGDPVVRRMFNYPQLAESDPLSSNPINISYDSSQRTIGIVKAGFSIQISRPTNGKRGRISRPTNVHIASGNAVLAMAKLNKKGKVGSVNAFTGNFTSEGGLSNFVTTQTGEWLISTYSGQLYSVDLADDLKNSTVNLVGNIGSNVDRIEYYSDRSSVVAINSFTPDDEGIHTATSGSLVVARLTPTTAGGFVQALLPIVHGAAKPTTSIRRPCNIRR